MTIADAASQRASTSARQISTIEKAAKIKTGGAARAKPFTTSLMIGATIVGHPQALDDIVRSFSEAGGEGFAAGRRLVLQEATLKSLDVGPGSVDSLNGEKNPERRNPAASRRYSRVIVFFAVLNCVIAFRPHRRSCRSATSKYCAQS